MTRKAGKVETFTRYSVFRETRRIHKSKKHIANSHGNGIQVCNHLSPSAKFSLDQNPDNKDEATEKFYDISAAYETLIDSEKRAKYDIGGEAAVNGEAPGGGGHGHFQRGDPFEQFRTFFQFYGGDGGDFGGFGGGFPGGHGGFHPPPPKNLYDENSGVTEISNANEWNEKVTQRSDIVIVDFYSPSCQPCKDLKDQYISVAKTFNGIVQVLAVNCLGQASSRLCQSERVQNYPTIRMYTDNNKQIDFPASQQKSSKNIGNWIASSMPDVTTRIDSQSKLNSFLESAGSKAVVFLFSDKQQTPALLKSVCRSFKSNVACGVVLGYSASAPPKYIPSSLAASVEKTPTLFYLHDPVTFAGETFKGSMTSEIISLFFSRVVSHRSRQVSVDQLTATRKADCSPSDSSICVLMLVDPKADAVAAESYKTLKQLAEKYASDPVKFYWVDPKSKFVSLFREVGSSRIVAYRGKRNKYSAFEGTVDTGAMSGWLDNILEGGSPLPHAATRKPSHDEL